MKRRENFIFRFPIISVLLNMFNRKKKNGSAYRITISGVTIDVVKKNIKNLNLRVKPSGQVRISCPVQTRDESVRQFANSKMSWIKKHLSNFQKKKTVFQPGYKSGEIHHYFGQPFSLRVIEKDEKPKVQIIPQDTLSLYVRPGADFSKREAVLKEWYRSNLKREIERLIRKWEPVMGVVVHDFGVKQMKTRWGTCNIQAKRIWLNLKLAKMNPEFLEYVVVHEMVHLLERLHNQRFHGFMTRFLPDWKSRKKRLNSESGIGIC